MIGRLHKALNQRKQTTHESKVISEAQHTQIHITDLHPHQLEARPLGGALIKE